MKNFRKNVFRLLMQNKGSFIGAVFIIAIGIFVYVAMMDTLRNLREQVEQYYESSNMADIFAEVSGISESELQRLTDIPGIEKASGKMAADIRLLFDGQEEIVTVHLLSYDKEDDVNQLTLSKLYSASDGLYLGTRMTGVYGFAGGEELKLLWNGNAAAFTYAGICNAPDYIYSIPPGGAMIPDGEIYDIACMEKERMEELTGKKDSLNELGFTLTPGYTWEQVRDTLSERLKLYGLISLIACKDQASFNMVEGEISELISVGTILPVIFMAISIFMLYVVLKKMIDRDQTLIGTMKAFGLTNREMMGAYMLEGAAAGILGAVLGSFLAVPFGKYMFNMYIDFFNLSDTVYHSYISSRLSGLLIAAGTGILAAFLGVRDILSIAPAQAMRAKAPAMSGNIALPAALLRRLGTTEKMACRSMVRNPFRGFLIILAVGFPFAMSSTLFSFDDVADQMFMSQFEKIQVYDLQLSLDRYVSPLKAVQSAEFLDDVAETEAICTIAAELRKDSHSEYIMLYGLNPGSNLWKIMDNQNTFYEPPENGLIINSRVAENLHTQAGEVLEISCPGLTNGTVKIPVIQVIEECLGSGCYMSLNSFSQVFQSETPANTILIKTLAEKTETVKKRMTETSHVTWLVDTSKIIDSYRDMMGSMIAMIDMFSLMAVAAGGILIYNISMINIRERATEFGTLMVLGKSDKELGRLILFEQMAYFAAGILLGFPGSYGLKLLIEKLIVSESYAIRLTIGPASYAAAFLICICISLLAAAAEIRFVYKIRLTDILKERE